MRNLASLLVLSLALVTGACTSDKSANQEPPKTPAGSTQGNPDSKYMAAEPTTHEVMCGCAIDGVGRCGNYILIEGQYVPMIHGSLGKMEWCAQGSKGAKVETVGAMKDGKFVATSWKTVE